MRKKTMNIENTNPGEAFSQEIEHLRSLDKAQLQSIFDGYTLIQKSKNAFNSNEYKGNIGGIDVFVKTFIHRCPFLRMIYGRRILRNEYTANSTISSQGLARVARPYCWIGKDTLLFEFIQSRGALENPRHHPDFAIPDRNFFKELVDSLRALHRHGIAHGDIRRTNILIGKDEHPWLVDTASTIKKGSAWNIYNAAMFHILKAADDYAIAKIIFSYYPDWEDADLKKILDNPPWFLSLGHYLRSTFYPIFRRKKHKHTQKETKS